MDMHKFSIAEKNGKWQIVGSNGFPMGGYQFRSLARAQEVFDCLSRGGTMVDGYLIQPNEVQANSSAVSSGLGIGGIGSDDYNIATESEYPVSKFGKRKSSGQLWEPCAQRGCDNEPSCIDCGYCLNKHCHCGE